MTRSTRRRNQGAAFTGDQKRSRRPAGDPEPEGRLRRTPLRALVMAAIFGALVGWLIVVSADRFGLNMPVVPWLAPIALWVAVILVGGLGWGLRQRIQVRRERIDPRQAVTYLAVGKATALAGAVVAGGYLAFGLLFVGRWEAEAPRERVIRSAVAVLAGVGLMVAGVLMERACEVPPSDDDEDSRPKASPESDSDTDDRYEPF